MTKRTPRPKIKTTTICFKTTPRWKRHVQKNGKKYPGGMTELIHLALEAYIDEPPLTPSQQEARNKIES